MHELGLEWWRDHKWNRIENWVGPARNLFCSLKTDPNSLQLLFNLVFWSKNLSVPLTKTEKECDEWVGGYNNNKRRFDDWTSLLLLNVAWKLVLTLQLLPCPNYILLFHHHGSIIINYSIHSFLHAKSGGWMILGRERGMRRMNRNDKM